MVSVIIPVFNEDKSIAACLNSLIKQSFPRLEIIVVDDGSSDKTANEVRKFLPKRGKVRISFIHQEHRGPGIARNNGSREAQGDILVFADADMEFDSDFIKKLVAPIERGEAKGVFTKEEHVSNWEKPLARFWNYNQYLFTPVRIPQNHPDTSPVFRAVLKSEFEKAGGFTAIGYTDDWTLSRKLGYRASNVKGAVCYHRNPETYAEVFRQARWIAKNEFISGSLPRRIFNLLRFSVPVQFLRSLVITLKTGEFRFFYFIAVYSIAVNISILEFREKGKYK